MKSVLSFLLYMNSRDWTQVSNIAEGALYLLSHPASLLVGFLHGTNFDDQDSMLYFIISPLPDQQTMNWETTLVPTIADLLPNE